MDTLVMDTTSIDSSSSILENEIIDTWSAFVDLQNGLLVINASFAYEELYLFNSEGKVLKKMDLSSYLELPLVNLPNGVLFISDGKRKTQKFINP